MGVRDFGSKNGTYVNDERVQGERELKVGDELTIGPLRFSVHVDHAIGGKKRPKVKDVKEAITRTAEMATVGDEDLDISDWLDGDDEEALAQDDTQSFQTAKAGNALDDTSVPESGTASEASVQEMIEKTQQEDQPKDTQAAAMNVLRQMRQQQLEKQQKK
jgi:pSer/pThr/pTyr-binding forkhead associated (FHA) protein